MRVALVSSHDATQTILSASVPAILVSIRELNLQSSANMRNRFIYGCPRVYTFAIETMVTLATTCVFYVAAHDEQLSVSSRMHKFYRQYNVILVFQSFRRASSAYAADPARVLLSPDRETRRIPCSGRWHPSLLDRHRSRDEPTRVTPSGRLPLAVGIERC